MEHLNHPNRNNLDGLDGSIPRDACHFMGVAEAIGLAAAVGAGATVYGAVSASDSASNATAEQANASSSANALQQYEFDTQQANMKPWLTAGTSAINMLNTGMQPGGQFSTVPQFNPSSVNLQQDPGYQFRLQQGVDALTASGAAAGNLGSGNLGVALTNYGQNAGSQEYGQAYSRALDQYNSQLNAQNTAFNRLSGVAGTGQTAATQLGNSGANMASNVGNTLMQSATNMGNIGINQANTQNGLIQNGLQTGVNAYGAYNQNQMYQNYLQNQTMNGAVGLGYDQSTLGPGGYTYNNPSAVGPFLP